jgi:TolB-like protein/DNA-binding SARP family transcriptional activator
MAQKLKLFLLGGFDLRLPDGTPVAVTAKKNQGLLAYLALAQGMRQTRDKLVGLLWGDRGNEQARNSLRQALVALRRNLSVVPTALQLEGDMVAINLEAFEVDAVAFERLARSERPADLKRASEIYRGPLLDGVFVRADGFDDWLTVERERLQERAIAVFSRLLPRQTGSDAIITAQRLAQLAPASKLAVNTLQRATAERDASDLPPRPAATAAAAAENPLSPKPTIAVLPFGNLSDDAAQAFFSDGITEDIIAELSRFRNLQVIAANSSFRFRGGDAELKAAGRDLGARYVVLGSVRRTEQRLRVNARLIEAETGNQLCADRFDRDLGEVFDIQDDVARTIAATLAGKLDAAGLQQAKRKRPDSLVAYEFMLRGRERLNRYRPEDIAPAQELLGEAIRLDPAYASAHALLAETHVVAYLNRPRPEELDQAFAHALRAIDLDGGDAWCHTALSEVCIFRRQYDMAELHGRQALALNPNDAAMLSYTVVLPLYLARSEEALDRIDRVLRLDPYPPGWVWEEQGMALYDLGRYDDAIGAFQRMAVFSPWNHGLYAACLAQAAQMTAAREQAARCLHYYPDYSQALFGRHFPYRLAESAAHWAEGLGKAGIPV